MIKILWNAVMRDKKPFPNISFGILLLIFVIALQYIIALCGNFLLSGNVAFTDHYISELLIITSAIALGIILFLGFLKTGLPWKDLFPFTLIKPSLLISIIITCGGLIIILMEIYNISQMLIPMPRFITLTLHESQLSENIILSIFLLVLIKPISEELFFRGLLFGGFKKIYSIKKACFFSSLLFALFHLMPQQYLSTFIIGIYACWLYNYTESLTAPIIAHGILNGIPFLITKLNLDYIPGFKGVPGQPELQPLWFDITGLILITGGLYLSYEILSRTKDLNNSPAILMKKV